MVLLWLSILFQLSIISQYVIETFGFLQCGTAVRNQPRNRFLSTLYPQQETLDENSLPEPAVPCFWKGKAEESKWEERIEIEHLGFGQELAGHVVEDLLDGKTGPKLFFECGVGCTSNGKWRIVHGMLRLPKSKRSVAVKRAARLRRKKSVQLFVSRIQSECGRFEVCLTIEEAEKFFKTEKRRPVSSLTVGEEVVGVVVKLLPYGAMIDVGANRDGLLHIRTVAELHGRYIDKEKGLMAVGLERGAKVRLSVASINKRRLSLEFTTDVINDSKKIQQESIVGEDANSRPSSNSTDSMSKAELAEWAEYATESRIETPVADGNDEDDYYEEDDDEYDEDRDIEDSLGLGFY